MSTSRRTFIHRSVAASATLALGSRAPLLRAQDARELKFGPVAATTAGRVRGMRRLDGTLAYYGIPYGGDTSGSNRFLPPQAPAPWRDVRDTIALGLRSPQIDGPIIPEVGATDRHEPMGEDCLMLNVFTPDTARGDRPVMVWLHGGGYSVGSGGFLLYDGGNLARTQDVVVVTVNHRLNVFGYLHVADIGGDKFAQSANVGMQDIVAALTWVRENIVNFGGNPDNVTIFGQSGGAGKVCTLTAMPSAKGLFHRAIAMSGSAITGTPASVASDAAQKMLRALNISGNDIGALQQVPMDKMLSTMQSVGGLPLSPVVDGRILPANGYEPNAPEVSADVPMMVGSTVNETTFFLNTPLDPMDDAALMAALKQQPGVTDDSRAQRVVDTYRQTHRGISNVELLQVFGSDLRFRRGVLTTAERRAALNRAPMFVYYFTWKSPVRDGKLGAFHCVDIPFAFNNVDLCTAMVGAEQDRYALAQNVSSAFAEFARNGRPAASDLPSWTAFDSTNRSTMLFGNESRVVTDPNAAERALIESLS
ncbi:MAG: carboxylesterase/lipase family protein [Gammaproteobacteria bacterium]|nr:carboxylesterase/lipase family protein [Gammaproteobacteria bacterium]